MALSRHGSIKNGDYLSAYAEKDNASLNAAQEGGWHVVSMKNDWKKIFPFDN